MARTETAIRMAIWSLIHRNEAENHERHGLSRWSQLHQVASSRRTSISCYRRFDHGSFSPAPPDADDMSYIAGPSSPLGHRR
jgi:hypothetical protein